MKNTELNALLRENINQILTKALGEAYDTPVLEVPTGLAIPVVDAEGNEKYAVVKVSIPLGTRDGNGGYIPYDGYKEAEAWKEELAEKHAKHERIAKEKEAKIARDKARREAKAKAKQEA